MVTLLLGHSQSTSLQCPPSHTHTQTHLPPPPPVSLVAHCYRYGEEKRVKTTCVGVTLVDPVAESKYLIEKIKQYTM